MKPLNNMPTSDDGHRAMEHGLPLLRRDLYNVLADSAEPCAYEQVCALMPGVHASVLRTLIDGLLADRQVTVDRHGRYKAALPAVSA